MYDYKILLPELRDQYHIHGSEYKPKEAQGEHSTTVTRYMRKSREEKQKTISQISRNMFRESLNDVGMKPDLSWKEGFEAPTGTLTDKGFKTGILMLLK